MECGDLQRNILCSDSEVTVDAMDTSTMDTSTMDTSTMDTSESST